MSFINKPLSYFSFISSFNLPHIKNSHRIIKHFWSDTLVKGTSRVADAIADSSADHAQGVQILVLLSVLIAFRLDVGG